MQANLQLDMSRSRDSLSYYCHAECHLTFCAHCQIKYRQDTNTSRSSSNTLSKNQQNPPRDVLAINWWMGFRRWWITLVRVSIFDLVKAADSPEGSARGRICRVVTFNTWNDNSSECSDVMARYIWGSVSTKTGSVQNAHTVHIVRWYPRWLIQ